MKKVKEFKIEFIEKPDLFAKNELESIKGGLAKTCFIKGCTCKTIAYVYCPNDHIQL